MGQILFLFDCLASEAASSEKPSLQQNNRTYKRRLYIWQSLCLLKNFFTKSNVAKCEAHLPSLNLYPFIQQVGTRLWEFLMNNQHPQIRQYMAIFSVHFVCHFQEVHLPIIAGYIKNKNHKLGFSISLTFVLLPRKKNLISLSAKHLQ